ncbi:polycystin-1-like protein 1 [Leuresthes tenuis]|uniref:polycystin-1-like protein 1 n=1 Tax=Leuresthes tenuis TaxID=355514 RepID=UPI003B505F97
MLAAAFVCVWIALHPCFPRTCAAASSAGQESSPWLVGCTDASSLELFAAKGAGDLDPVRCSMLCLDERYQFAALSAKACYCGNQLYGLVVSGCFHTSYSEETKDVKGGSEKQRALHPLLGNGRRGNVALYRSEGPFLHNISVSASSDRVQAGRTFVIKVFGNLAGRPGQPTGRLLLHCMFFFSSQFFQLQFAQKYYKQPGTSGGLFGGKRIMGFGRKDLSHVTVEFVGKIPKGQSSLDVNVSDVGSFAVSSDWLLETPGKYDIDVRVSSPLSTLSSTLRLSVLQLPPGSLVISLLHSALGTPSCVPSTHLGSNNTPVEAAYRGEPVTLQACVKKGLAAQFCWWFSHKDQENTVEGVETACLSSSHCLNSSVVVVRPVVSDLKLSVSESQLTGGGRVSVDVELLTTMRHLLGLKLTLTAECNLSSENNKDPSSGGDCNHSVRIYAEKQVYPTNTDIIFSVVANITDPVEFFWDFGDSRTTRTTSRTIIKRYQNPGRFDLIVAASLSQMSVTSDVFPVVVQRAVKLNRLVHKISVLWNQTVTFICRVNVGTNLTFFWNFGDGTTRSGQRTEHHVFHRIGEFRVEVIASNLVSSASLSSYLFVVDRPCQPPPVKNMGPLKLQVWRHEVIHLGVTFEKEVDCDVSGDLRYHWTLFDSSGRTFPLPLTDTNRQSLTLQSHLLQCDTYTAIARVQVTGSVVYSNYTVRVQVMRSPPVAFIQGGTNIFVDKKSNKSITLDGQMSYDADYPLNPLSYSWTCKPVSVIPSSCFNRDVSTSSPVLGFPVGILKDNFDQFQFTLTVHSGERSASADVFLTLTSESVGKVSIYCPQCQGNHVNWDQSFSVSAVCEDCNVPAELIQYTWSLYLVNASSKPVIEVPFCYTIDFLALSAIMESPATSTLTPGISTLHSSDANVSQHIHTVYVSAAAALPEEASETKSKLENDDLADSPLSRPHTGLSESEPSSSPLALDSGSSLYSDQRGQSGIISEFPNDPGSSANWEFYFPLLESGDVDTQPGDYDVLFPSAEEGDSGTSAGRPTGVDAESFSSGDESAFDQALHEDEGSNLVDPKPSLLLREPSLLDLHRDAIDRDLFESYTYTGTSAHLLTFRPFGLSWRNRYMLEVTANSQDVCLGRAQLFLKTSPVPTGMTCQVQPVEGVELHTHFGIFCTSGREDLLYEYSFSAGGRPPRMLYQGRDFQYYFSLPAGDPTDDYKVTIYTAIRSGTYGSSTKPCPVTVQVKPSFLRNTSNSSSHPDPDIKLSESGLRNLSALAQLGNSAEIRNYISLLSSVLNRLSPDAAANTQTHMRNVLICKVCRLESSGQVSVADNILILKDLLQVRSQVTLASVRLVTAYVQAVSEQLSEFSDRRYGNQRMLNTLMSLLSYSLQVVTSCDYSPSSPKRDDITQTPESDSPTDESIKDFEEPHNRCLPDSSTGPHVRQGGSASIKQVVQLVDDILQTAADLMLRHIDTEELRVGTDLISVNAAYLKDNSTVIGSGSAIFYMPASLIAILFGHHGGDQLREDQPCVLRVLTELAHCPYTWARHHTQLSGPVVDLSLYRCGTRRKIHILSLSQPVSVELQLPQKNSSVCEYSLLRSQVNYHNFSITQEHMQQAIQVTVVFTPPPNNKAFPVMLLFRMFERPTPSMHHLHRIHQWENNTTRLTLLPSYLNAAGVAHLALLDAHFGSVTRRKHLTEPISYRLTVDSSLCLSWDGQQGTWTHRGCRTVQVDTNAAINCSCHQLRPLTVFQQQIHSSHDKANLDPFLSVPSNMTVLGVLLLCMCLYIPGLGWCLRADAVSAGNRRVHYLSDNSPADQYLYAVTVHTGLCSAARMSAKVYIVLYGADGFSQTRELQAPGCTLFRRNSQDTFILSAADSLGPVWGVHIWHDNSGPSADWYLKHVAVSELNKGHVEGPSQLFVSQCWLAVNKGDGRVERMLRVSTHGISFSKVLFLSLSDYLADFHFWMSVYSCPCPNSFTHTQRLCVCLLLLLGYACVNTVFISQTEDQLPFELGIIDVSAVSIKTGLVSVVAVLPAAVLISFLFRCRLIKLTRSGVQHASGRRTEQDYFEDTFSVDNSKLELHLSRSSLQQEAWRKKYQDTDLLSLATMILENKEAGEDLVIQPDLVIKKDDALTFESSGRPAFKKLSRIAKVGTGDYTPERSESELISESCRFCGTKRATRDESQTVLRGRGFRLASLWCHHVAWALCLLLCLCSLVISAVLGMSFSSSKVLLWIHSLFISLMSCIFLIQPAVILAVAVTVSCLSRKRRDFHCFNLKEFQIDTSKLWNHNGADQPAEEFRPLASPQTRSLYLEKLLGARQRARYLRLVRPPTPAELRKSRDKKRREALIHKTLRDLCLCGAMLLLMMCISYSSSFKEHYHLNRAVKRLFLGNHHNAFMSIKNHDDWWRWTQTSLLQSLYHNASAKTELSHIIIGDPIIQKTETSNAFPSQVPVATNPRTCDHTGCYSESVTTVDLGHTKPDAVSQLKLLHSVHWLGRETVALKVQCTLYSPAPNLFTSMTLLTEQNPSGALLPSTKVQSVKVYHTPAVWDYFVMVCQLLFLFLSLLQLCQQMSTVAQRGLMGYWRTPCTWVEVSLLIMTLVYYIYYINHSIMILELVELLKRHNNRTHVDVSFAATSEQCIRTLHGFILLLLTMKCGTVLRVNRTLAVPATVFSQSFSSFLWPTVAGLILLVALSCIGNLLYVQSSWAFSSLPRSLQTLLCHHQDLLANRGLLLSGRDYPFWGVLYLFSTAVWAAVAIGAMSSLVRSAKRSQSRRNVFTMAEMFSYIRLKLSEFTGKQRQTRTDYHEERRSYILEEFESIVDELLFRLNALYDSLHHTLPPKAHYYREEESPVISPTAESSSVDTQDSVRSQMMMNKPTHVSDRGQTTPASCLFRSQLEQQIQKVLHQRGQKTNIHSDVATDEPKIKDCLACPESTTLESRWTEDICQRRAELCTRTNGSCRVNTIQTTTSKVVVEALVHQEPQRELDMYSGPPALNWFANS